jgi:hypothetical protein
MNDIANVLNLLGVSVEEFAERSGCRLSLTAVDYKDPEWTRGGLE